MLPREHGADAALKGRVPDRSGDILRGAHLYSMKKKLIDQTTPAEPLGIVISQGSRAEETPRFVAYVWGPAPEADADLSVRAA